MPTGAVDIVEIRKFVSTAEALAAENSTATALKWLIASSVGLSKR